MERDRYSLRTSYLASHVAVFRAIIERPARVSKTSSVRPSVFTKKNAPPSRDSAFRFAPRRATPLRHLASNQVLA